MGIESPILPGIKIGEGAIIGAGSLVTKDIPSLFFSSMSSSKNIKE